MYRAMSEAVGSRPASVDRASLAFRDYCPSYFQRIHHPDRKVDSEFVFWDDPENDRFIVFLYPVCLHVADHRVLRM